MTRDLGKKKNCLQKATGQSPWTTICSWFTPSLMLSRMVTAYLFFAGPIALHGLVHDSGHNWSLPY